MSSDRRLHPYSIIFAFLAQIRAFVLPGLLVLVGASSRGGSEWWQPWMMVLVIPNAIVAALRYARYRYRYDANEMVIRSGLLFRKERHIPYGRIQNVDAVQNVLHRLLNVVEVRVETGGGQTAEATMSVLPAAALQEMRERVFAERRSGDAAQVEAEVPEAVGRDVLRLDLRELLLCGFLENRGAVLIAAGFGVVWELGLFDRGTRQIFGDDVWGRRVVRDLLRDVTGNVELALSRVAITIAAFVVLLLFIRLLSMAWAAIRLYGFRLTLADEDLRSEYGLLTRVVATIPLRRVQTVSVSEGPLHRLFRRVAVRADTAGGRPQDGSRAERESLAPILKTDAMPPLVRLVLHGDADVAAVTWQPVAPRAFRREVKGWLVMAGFMSLAAMVLLRWWSLVLVPIFVAWALFTARQTVKHLGWAVTDEAVFFRSGWLWRRMNIVRFAKIQTVTVAASPFDRRAAMARVRVDTAGASEATRINIPYLPREVARKLHARLAHEAARRQFKWQ
jgi:putative membrane protein